MTETEAKDLFEPMPGSKRRVRFADTEGMELVTIVLFDQYSALEFTWSKDYQRNQAFLSNSSIYSM